MMRVFFDAEADMPLTEVSGAICVQKLDDSRDSAIHIMYRISLRSSSLREPSDPLLQVVFIGTCALASTDPFFFRGFWIMF